MKDEIILPSNKKFGYIFAIIFSLVSFIFYLKNSYFLYITFLVLSITLIVISTFFDRSLRRYNLIWYKFGIILGKIISPIVLALIYFTLFIPLALLFRLIGRDELRLKRKYFPSYWKDIKNKTHYLDDLRNQY